MVQKWKQPNVLQQINGYANRGKGIQLNNKSELIIDAYNNLDDSQRHYSAWKKSVSKGYMGYDSIYMTFLKREN